MIRTGMRSWRVLLLWCALAVALLALLLRLFYLQMNVAAKGHGFLKRQGDIRVVRNEVIAAGRGEILDRHGDLLAYSTPVQSIWVKPAAFEHNPQDLRALASLLDLTDQQLRRRLGSNPHFVYLRRQIDPSVAQRVLALDIKGVHAQTEYKRFYPAAEFAAHIVGFTDVEDHGQEGVELAFDHVLEGQPGRLQVMRNAIGEPIKDLGLLRAASSGGQLQLSIDMDLQYIAYRELKAAVAEHNARSGSMVILDAQSGEVLALVNQPSYNVNDRSQLLPAHTRNRALIDVFEPGSTIKPFTIAAALEHGEIKPSTVIDTSPGVIRLGRKAIVDPRDYGALDVADVLVKSSQVGTTKISLGMPAEQLRGMLARVGFGEYCATGFPGEQVGFLPHHRKWRPVQRATLAYGHGMSVNLMQLARAYAVIAADGVKRPVSLLKSGPSTQALATQAGAQVAALEAQTAAGHKVEQGAEQVMAPGIAAEIRTMMVDVVDRGTGTAARIPGYSVAGKTGTTHRVGRLGYEENRYRATFAGILPASSPRLVVAVTIDDPRGEQYYGGEIAAPVFARVMRAAVRLMNIAPDRPGQLEVRYANQPGPAQAGSHAQLRPRGVSAQGAG